MYEFNLTTLIGFLAALLKLAGGALALDPNAFDVALRVAFSPMPIVAVILMLVSRRGKMNGPRWPPGWASRSAPCWSWPTGPTWPASKASARFIPT